MAGETEDVTAVRLLCSKLVPATSKQDSTSLQWLIGSPFFPPYTIASTILCTHFDSSSLSSPAVLEEAEDLRSLIIRGFRVIGALVSGVDGDPRRIASEAIDCAIRLNKCLGLTGVENTEGLDLVGGVLNSGSGEARFFVRKGNDLVDVLSVSFEHDPEQYVWDRGCLLRCELPIELPVYYRASKSSGRSSIDAEQMHLRSHEALLAKLKDPSVTFIMESSHKDVAESALPIVIRGADLDFTTCHSYAKPLDDFSQATGAKYLPCSHFCLTKKNASTASVENADMIEVAIMINSSGGSPNMDAPVAQFCPASEEVKLWNVDFKLEVICYAAKYLPLKYAIAELLIPALIDQLNSMKRLISPCLLKQLIRLRPYHFSPPGILHPITVIYDLTYGEMESAQVEMRRSLHRRLGLPSDRPLLRAANALNFSKSCNRVKGSLKRGTPLLRDVHLGIPSSGVSGGTVSLVQGSYEYHHYLQDGFDDSGWGCAYRSLQTIISWFRLQLYTAVDVPLHREIQHALVEIGDKDPSFIGSREWIGAIELSYVLDKLLGVTCKVMNVRSGSELPEKCRELALHFEYQGTPIMIGGGVLAYTLLGVDYNEVSGDCAFLILDPHYTGGEDLKKIVNGGWCGWKQAIDSKGKKFFLDDKFYNLLLPQRPNMV